MNMIVRPKIRGFICTTAHPQGCAANVRAQADYVKGTGGFAGPKRVLVVGSSTGYGLACRIAAAFGCGADTVGVYFERPASGTRTATAGWYNDQKLELLAARAGLAAYSINGDAFSDEVKAQAVERVKKLPGGQVDLVIYSLAAPRRANPRTGESHSSVIKPVGGVFRGKSVNVHTGVVSQAEVEPATEQEVADTVAVMGGEDWLWWIHALSDAGALAQGAGTVAFSYIGPEQTHAIYADGTMGMAKKDLERRVAEIDALLAPLGGKAFVSVNKALVTQASAAIPVVPLYISLLYKVMKHRGSHESCIEQMYRMLRRLYAAGTAANWSAVPVDEAGRVRMDDWEMDPAVQQEVMDLWDDVTTETLEQTADLTGYRQDFYQLFGFSVPGVDYEADVEIYSNGDK